MRFRIIGIIAAVLLATQVGQAHFPILQAKQASAKKGEAVTVTYQWGHPFEHELFDAAAPDKLVVLGPDGKEVKLAKAAEKISVPGAKGKKTTAYLISFTPAERGDFTIEASAPPVWMEEDKEFFQDSVRVVAHVQVQQGWDRKLGKGFELVPLTRPYGLLPGTVFQAQALYDGKPLAGAHVEVERFNPEPPKKLPPDEHRTLTLRTDPNGIATAALNEAGWWCMAVEREGGKKEREGKSYPVKQRAVFWVLVDEKTR